MTTGSSTGKCICSHILQVIFVTGPAAAGRATLLSSVLRGLPATAEDQLRMFKLLTTDERFALQGSDWCVGVL